MVRTVSPNANATPAKPIPSSGPWSRCHAAASTALPQPPKVRTKVPRSSALRRLVMPIGIPHLPTNRWILVLNQCDRVSHFEHRGPENFYIRLLKQVSRGTHRGTHMDRRLFLASVAVLLSLPNFAQAGAAA